MQEYFVIHTPRDGEKTKIARVFAEDDNQARIKGYALLEGLDDDGGVHYSSSPRDSAFG